MKLSSEFQTIAKTLLLTLALTACVDTTGISGESSRPPAGNPQAAVLVEEFADLQCPSCRAANETLKIPLLQKYGTQIAFVHRHFPLRAIHRYAMELAEASECAADQGKFWDYVDMAYDRQPDLKKGSAAGWAEDLALDMDLFDRCTRSHIKRDTIQADYDEGITRGVQGTPTFFVNGQQTPATIDGLSAAIDAALSQTIQRL